MYFRRTTKELKAFNEQVEDFMTQGYPRYAAEERAWDIFHSNRKARGYTPRFKAQV